MIPDLPSLDRLLSGEPVPLRQDSELHVRVLKKSELELVVEFRKAIFERGLDNPDFVRPEPDEVKAVAVMLEGEGISFGVFDGECLIAYTSMCIPTKANTLAEMGLLAAITKFCAVDDVAYMPANMVNPSFRGRGVNNALVTLKYEIAPLLGRNHRFGMCSISNTVALHNQLKYYAIVDILKLEDTNFGPLTRFLTYSPVRSLQHRGPVFWVGAADKERQMDLLESRYRGVKCRVDASGIQVGYRLIA